MKPERDWNALLFAKLRSYQIHFLCHFTTFITKLELSLRKVKYGKGVKFYGKTYFFRFSNSSIILGNNVRIRSDKRSNQIGLMRRSFITTLAENAQITIGDNSGFSGVSIGAAKKISIGSKVVIGANCLITDTNWHNMAPELRHKSDPNPGEIIIGNNVFIGYGSIVLKNVSIGENTVIGAGSVVTKSIPSNAIASGNPCKVIKYLT